MSARSRPALAALPHARAALAAETLRWCDAFWDDARGLAWAPPGAHAGQVHLVPQSAWYAYGLLLRDAPGDLERARRCVEALLALQYDEPGQPWHGSFARFAETPAPRPGALMWVDFDPNWRQFLGTTFCLLLHDFPAAFDGALVARIEAALRLAVTGEPPDRISPSYANIALLHAYLLCESGARLGEAAWIERGEALAREAVARFDRDGAFEEYNSPTYYGIDLHALGLWVERASSPVLRELGRRVEATLWRDIARWYHAGLRNLCGPFSRTYGMDMGRYVGALGLHLWAALGREHAPLPPLQPDAEHGHDFFLGALEAVLGARVPDDARPALLAFPGEHAVEQVVAPDPARRATGWLAPDVMLGAESNDSARFSAFDQYVAATAHWARPDGGVGWLSARAAGAPRGRASAGRLELEIPAGAAGEALVVHVFAPEGAAADYAEPRWTLPGIALEIATDLPAPRVERERDAVRLRYERAGSGAAARWALRVVSTGR